MSYLGGLSSGWTSEVQDVDATGFHLSTNIPLDLFEHCVDVIPPKQRIISGCNNSSALLFLNVYPTKQTMK